MVGGNSVKTAFIAAGGSKKIKGQSKAFIDVTDAQKRKWKVEISGDMFIATSSDEMDGGAGHEVRYDRATGDFSGYGFEASK